MILIHHRSRSDRRGSKQTVGSGFITKERKERASSDSMIMSETHHRNYLSSLLLLSAVVLSSAKCSTNIAHGYSLAKRRVSAWMILPLQQQPVSPRGESGSIEADLGETLFFDKRLSRNGSLSCSNCHDPSMAFADHNMVAVGLDLKPGRRNTPTILNAKFSETLFSDGRAATLEEQAGLPLTNPSEMGLSNYDAAVERVSSFPEYKKKFKRVFGTEGITIDTIVKALATYERTLVSSNSPFDRFIAGDLKAISETQRVGWELFKGKGRCITCHEVKASVPLFTDYKFHNTGVATRNHNLDELVRRVRENTQFGATRQVDADALAHTEGFCELGRFNVTRQSSDVGAFKTAALRDVELTAPYMHNGSIKTLIDVVRFYNKGGEVNSHLDPEMKPLGLTTEEMNNLVEFLRALTSDDVLKLAQTTKPQARTPLPLPPARSR
jgi:cytochrome c peroxidase